MKQKIIIVFLFIFMAMPMIALAQSDCAYACNDLSIHEDDTSFCASFGGTVGPFVALSPDQPSCAGLTSDCGLYSKAVCCCGSTLSNIVYKQTPPKFEIPEMQINIPTVKLSQVHCDNNEDGSYYCDIPWIGEYVVGIYDYALSIAGILAAVVLMAGGLLWVVSGGDASKITQAKEMIMGAIIGLLILAVSFLLLNRLNPDFTKFEPIRIGYVSTSFLENSSDSEANNAGSTCPQESNLINFNNLGLNIVSSASNPLLTPDAIQGLKKAVTEAEKVGVKLRITDAFRSYATQERLWQEALKTYKNEATARKYCAKPSPTKCSSHLAGTTIDVCILGTGSCSHMGFKVKANATYSDADVTKLQTIMKKAGWKRYCGEWWHFQYNDPPGSSCSP